MYTSVDMNERQRIPSLHRFKNRVSTYNSPFAGLANPCGLKGRNALQTNRGANMI
jgi:hypothetical protein